MARLYLQKIDINTLLIIWNKNIIKHQLFYKMRSSNKRIAINTAVIYLRLAIVTVVSLLTTRYVLQILGAADYGLFNVVASVITMLNCISAAMYTTTRRFINVEMGKPNGNLNKIFNISLILHIGFALLILLICESLGIWYINN